MSRNSEIHCTKDVTSNCAGGNGKTTCTQFDNEAHVHRARNARGGALVGCLRPVPLAALVLMAVVVLDLFYSM